MRVKLARLFGLTTSAVMLSIVLSGAAPTDRTSAGECGNCNESWAQNLHGFSSMACSVGSYGCFDCNYLNSCHQDFQTGTCQGYHASCGIEMFAVEDALVRHDLATLAALIKEQPEGFIVNEDRELLQVLNCSGWVVAQYALTSELADALD